MLRPAVPTSVPSGTRPPRVGLVLGAGGTVGIAWIVGALRALEEHAGWDPSSADVLSGTSAGSVIAAVLAAGIDPGSLLRMAEDPEALDAAIAAATAGRPREGRSLPLPGSLALGVTGLMTADVHRRLASLSGFLPRGMRSTADIRGLTHCAVADGWPQHTKLWIHACDFRSGKRVTFGREGAPDADLADAVAASCAVPGYYRPVRIGDRHYVDGGLWSFTNADVLAGEDLDVVICLSPTSAKERGPLLDMAVSGLLRRSVGSRLRGEVRALEERGTRVVTIEPSAADLAAMGLNPMGRSRSRRIIDTARRSVAAQLDAQGPLPVAAAARADDAALAA